jgi:UPF0755 protein
MRGRAGEEHVKIVVRLFLALVVVCGMAAGAGYYVNTAPVLEPGQAAAAAGAGGRLFAVDIGESLAMVADRLYLESAIRSPVLLRGIAGVRGTDTSIKAGYFSLPFGATTLKIHDLLVAGHQQMVKVTVPEGWTISKVAAHLEDNDIVAADAFEDVARDPGFMSRYGMNAISAEGYLFPDTYFFPRRFPAAAVVGQMVDNFFARLAEIYPAYVFDDPAQVHNTLIVASIVEREYRVAAEAPLIASVFYNRLGVNVGLESCATLQYIITEIQGKPHPERIFHSDLRIESDYNTYKWHGLPPGPISNPGLTALQAAFFPPETDYWYFVVRDAAAGRHYFSSDLEEHNEAKFLFLKGA